MIIKYNLDREDYLDFNMDYLLASGIVKRFFYMQKIFLAIVLFLVLYLFQKEYNVSKTYLTIFYIVFYLLWAVFEGFIIKILVKIKLLSDLKKDIKIIGEKEIEVKEDGLYDNTNGSSYLIKWKFVKFIDDLEKYIFIFTSLNSGYIIPKKYIENTDEFVKIIKNKIDSCEEA